MLTDNQTDLLIESGAYGIILNDYIGNKTNKISDEEFSAYLDSYLLTTEQHSSLGAAKSRQGSLGAAEQHSSLGAAKSRQGSLGAAEQHSSLASKVSGNTFYIYTTGLTDNPVLIDMWFNILSDNILSCIPDTFQKEVIHYDPISENLSKEILDKVNDDLKIRDQLLFKAELPITELKRPHIVIDMAHIFGYYPSKENRHDVYFSGYYDQSKKNLTPLGIKSIYLGFNGSNIASSKRLITVKPDGSVTTFIDRLIDLGMLNLEEININEVIEKIAKKIKDKFFALWKSKGGSLADFDDLFEQYNFESFVISKLFDSQTKDMVYDIKDYNLYSLEEIRKFLLNP